MDNILEEVRRDVFEHPKSSISLDYLYFLKKQVQDISDNTNSQLKKNVYQNYSLFIESSREISTLKDEMKQLNILLEQQQGSMNNLLDQLNKTPIIQPNLERTKEFVYSIPSGDVSEQEAETFPAWYTKSPEDFDVLIAQRNLREAVDLALKIKKHVDQYPAVTGRPDLKEKIESRQQELVDAICSELQPAADRTVQGGPRSSVVSIQLLRELNLSSKAVQLYLDQRSSVLHFVLDQQKVESTMTLQFIKQFCEIFYRNISETCSEFKQAFEVHQSVNNAANECKYTLDIQLDNHDLLFDSVAPIYLTPHPPSNSGSPSNSNGNDITSRIFNQPAEKLADYPFNRNRNVFYHLSTYASLTHWIVQEFEHFTRLFRRHVFNNPQLSVSTVAESVYHLRNLCSRMAKYCEIDMSEFIERDLADQIDSVIKESGRKLRSTIKKLDSEEQWQPQQFQNKAQLTLFFEKMNGVELKTMPHYIFEDLKLRFTACKTSFAHYYLITVSDLAKLINPMNKKQIDDILASAFEQEMESVVEALKKVKASKARFIMGNSNFLLDKVIVEAQKQYKKTTNEECNQLNDIRNKYHAKVKSAANI